MCGNDRIKSNDKVFAGKNNNINWWQFWVWPLNKRMNQKQQQHTSILTQSLLLSFCFIFLINFHYIRLCSAKNNLIIIFFNEISFFYFRIYFHLVPLFTFSFSLSFHQNFTYFSFLFFSFFFLQWHFLLLFFLTA